MAIGIGRGQQRPDGEQQQRHQHREDGDGDLERCVERQGAAGRQRSGIAPGGAGAGGKPAHERREHGARRGQAVTHVQREQPGPDDFVDESRGAGHREEDQERAAPHQEESIIRLR